MKPLYVNHLFSREDVHAIFSPNTNFTPQAGTWGLRGIIGIPDRERDYVFFVTYGQAQSGHEFDEGITEDGVLSWQSQPSQDFQNKVVKNLITHDDLVDNIYLFLREDKREDYRYLGRLGYLSHDNSREKPVYFQWQLLNWHDLDASSAEIASDDGDEQGLKPLQGELKYQAEMPAKKRAGTSQESFRTRKAPDYAARDAKNRKQGLAGELLVLEYEKNRLIEAGFLQLAESIEHTSVIKGDGAGYDIKSFNEDGSIRYIEVKTTTGSIDTDFFMSPNEIKFSKLQSEKFYLYRLFEWEESQNVAQFFFLQGDVLDRWNAQPTNYKMSFK